MSKPEDFVTPWVDIEKANPYHAKDGKFTGKGGGGGGGMVDTADGPHFKSSRGYLVKPGAVDKMRKDKNLTEDGKHALKEYDAHPHTPHAMARKGGNDSKPSAATPKHAKGSQGEKDAISRMLDEIKAMPPMPTGHGPRHGRQGGGVSSGRHVEKALEAIRIAKALKPESDRLVS